MERLKEGGSKESLEKIVGIKRGKDRQRKAAMMEFKNLFINCISHFGINKNEEC